MTYKPMKLWAYLTWIRRYGWRLKKGSIDWNLIDENQNFVCSIKVQHPGKSEIAATSVEKTKRKLRERGKEYESKKD